MKKPLKPKKIKINSLSKFLSTLDKYNVKNDKDHTLFFRGMSNETYKDVPSIYRKNKEEKAYYDLAQEHNIFIELTRRCPEYFKNCKTTFDHLVVMQHYGYPTRLLDITENPLVALYFACKNNSKNGNDGKIGKVNIYKIDSKEIRNYKSDSVSIVANIVKVNNALNYLYLYCKQLLSEICNELNITETNSISKTELQINEIINLANTIENFFNISYKTISFFQKNFTVSAAAKLTIPQQTINEMANSVFDFMLNSTKELHTKIPKLIYKQITRKSITDKEKSICKTTTEDFLDHCNFMMDFFIKRATGFSKEYLRLINFIKEEKPHFNSRDINVKDIASILCVSPKQDNQRVIKQNGSFFLFGLAEDATDKTTCAEIPNEYYFQVENKRLELIINPEDKERICNELKLLSISQDHLFPEIETVASELIKKYRLNS